MAYWDPQIGERLAIARYNNHMSQLELAEAIDVSVKHVSEVERGIKGMSVDKLIRCCETLHCSMDYLTRGIEMSHFPVEDFHVNEIEITLFTHLYSNANDKQKELILLYLDTLRENKT